MKTWLYIRTISQTNLEKMTHFANTFTYATWTTKLIKQTLKTYKARISHYQPQERNDHYYRLVSKVGLLQLELTNRK